MRYLQPAKANGSRLLETSAMRLGEKALQILHDHGLRGLTRRAGLHIRRSATAWREARAQRAAWEKLSTRAGTQRPVFFPRHEQPLVSIVVPVFNNLYLTATCLNAILRELDSIPCEVIVVDDASTDDTAEYLASCSGIRIVTHVNNHGFVHSANDGAAAARGRYIHFLNNDTIVTPGWMPPLLRTFESRSHVGAAASQLRAADGTISEAGAFVWRDGHGWNYGRQRPASDPSIAFPREVDYCSAASLMVRADVFRQLGGFSTEFAPGYYEDVDLCFRLREVGYRTLYQPESIVLHLEGGTAGTDGRNGMKRWQEQNRHLFVSKWQAELTSRLPGDERLVERAARRLCGTRTALVIDSFIPFDDRSAGGRRTAAIMQLMRGLGWHVIFVPEDGGTYEPYTSRVRRAGIEVLPHRGDARTTIMSLPVPIDVAWICRPDLMQKYAALVRTCTTAKIVYDTIDLHFLRLHREESLKKSATDWQAVQSLELQLARQADLTVVTGEHEQQLLRDAGIESSVVPIIERGTPPLAGFAARHDFLFLGNYTHAPNADAAVWLANSVMPLIWERIPNARLILAGADPTPAVQRLAGTGISVPGYIPDILPMFEQARIFIAPLRFGAGMKGKVVQSLAHGLPVVTTSVGSEGIGLIDGVSALIANDALGLANAAVRLYNDEALWKTLSVQGETVAALYSPSAVKAHVDSALNGAFKQDVQVGINVGFSTHSA